MTKVELIIVNLVDGLSCIIPLIEQCIHIRSVRCLSLHHRAYQNATVSVTC